MEDEDDLREMLVETIKQMGYAAIGCPNSAEFEKRFSSANTGCVLLDYRLPGGDGIATLERIERSGSALRAIMITGLSDATVAAECMKIGAVDYLVKPVGEMSLRRAIDRAVGLSRMKHCRSESAMLIKSLLEQLTSAETKIAEMLARGFSTKMIAGELDRSENTVKIHRHRIMSKLKINSVASLANIFNHVDNH